MARGATAPHRGFDGHHQRYCYNAAGELTHLIEAGGSDLGPGKVTHFERDALGRLTAKESEGDDRCTAHYRYDRLGRLTAADNPAAKLAFAYDPAGRLTQESQTLAGNSARHLAHAYDPLGNRTRTALPDGRALNWLFYGSGHLHQFNLETAGRHDVICDFERDALHREIARSQGTVDSYFDYDPAGRLVRHRAHVRQAATAAIERRYRYDAAGRLIARQDNRRGNTDYRYDPTGRILAARGRFNEYFAFDPAGNLLDTRPGDPPPQGRVGGNRLRVHQDLRFDYDVHGNVSRRKKGSYEEATYTWNADHQLAEARVARHGVTQTTRYEYDALGRRTRKLDAFGSTEYLWDGDLMIASQRGNKAALYLYEPDSFVPLATIQDGNTYWYQCDQIGAPQELTDAEGRIVWAAEYKVWGEATLLRTGTDDRAVGGAWAGESTPSALPVLEQPFRFQGQQFDEETGLHYNRFRYYDPGVGRFVSQDPIGLWGGENLFAYGPNPTGWIDPQGLAKSTIKCQCGCRSGGFNPVTGKPRGTLQRLAQKIREAGKHPASVNQRTIAVGMDESGGLHAGSSNGFDSGQRAMAEQLGIKTVPSSKNKHAEENLMKCVTGLKSVGTSKRDPCGPDEHDCAGQLRNANIDVDNV